jgi:hypothetical protein
MVKIFTKVDPDYGNRVREGLKDYVGMADRDYLDFPKKLNIKEDTSDSRKK